MKTNFFTPLFKTALLVVLSFSLANCSKDDDPAPVPNPEVNPLADYLLATGFNQATTNQVNAGDYEFGLAFKPTVNGNITALVVKIPDVRVGMRVTIWNKTTANVLRTEIVDVTSSGVEVTKVITPLAVVANTEYMVTFNSNDWYDRRKTDASPVTYPFTVGDLSITSYGYSSGTAQNIPLTFPTTYYAGDISFKFQKS